MPGVAWTSVVSTVHMISGTDWTMTTGDVLVALAILLLCGEVMKSSRISRRTIIDHALSLILFLGMLIEFILVKQAATATFFLLLVVGFIDVLGGFAVTLRSAHEILRLKVSSAFRPDKSNHRLNLS
jgi:hypothetical protein